MPNTIDNTASGASMSCHAAPTLPMPCASSRNANANDAIFGTVDRNNVTAVGAPLYTSGTHMWNGTAPYLKSFATSMTDTARMNPSPGSAPICADSKPRSSVPLMPYSTDMP